ncbi:lipopolysaccharide biosynthesis protein [Oerskovia flava]|uniref:lipopolysaccharide biosynthesis protein n=1 Tax=Oerskovia flava TaxID=2986422 RepID=UPI00223F8C6E|nr:oligosaccharide flippase family protein [Oerskovia sp. JB1-3-2]
MIGQFAWLTCGRLFAAVLQAFTFGALALAVNPVTLGAVGTALAVLLVLQTVCDLGVATYLVRTRATDPHGGRIRAGVAVNRITTVPLFLLAALVALAVGSWSTAVSGLVLLPLAVWAAAERNAETVAGLAVADGRAGISVANLVSRRVVALVVFAALAWQGADPVLGYGIGMAVGALVSVAWINAVMRARIAPDRVALGVVVREARPYWANSVAVQARNLDVAVVAGLAGAAAGGIYSLASRLTVPLRLVPTSLAAALLPHAARASGTAEQARVRGTVYWLVAAISAVYLVLAAMMPTLVQSSSLFEEFAPAILPIQILLVALPFGAVASVATSLLQAQGYAGFVSWTAALMSAVCLVGAAIGAVVAGAAGAALAFGAALALQALVLTSKLVAVHRTRDTTGRQPRTMSHA